MQGGHWALRAGRQERGVNWNKCSGDVFVLLVGMNEKVEIVNNCNQTVIKARVIYTFVGLKANE